MKEIGSQSIIGDRVHLHRLGNCFQTNYDYLEIGVYHGGSLALQLRNPKCKNAMAVDLYPQTCPDERHLTVLGSMSFQVLTGRLQDAGYDITKMQTHSGDISSLAVTAKYDYAFIDAEHTNRAAFKDAIHCMKHLKDNSIMLFHDTTLVYGAIDCFGAYLELQEIPYKRYKLRNSELTLFLFGSIPSIENYCIKNESDYEDFKLGAKIRLADNVKKYNENWMEYTKYGYKRSDQRTA